MRVSDNGIKFITAHEGQRLRVYRDPIGLATVGVGHLVLTKDNLDVGDVITPEQSDAFLRQDLGKAENKVNAVVKVPLTQNQFDACVSLVFNIGGGAFERSTLLKHLNAGNYALAAAEFDKWNKAGGKVWPGLVRRRAEEKALFLK